MKVLLLFALLISPAAAQSIPPQLGDVPAGTTLVARPVALDCTLATVGEDKVHVDWGCVDAYAVIDPHDQQFGYLGELARLLKAVREGRAQ